MRRWWLVIAGTIALPMALWLIFAATVWFDGAWETDSYALNWTFNLAIVISGWLAAIIVPLALVLTAVEKVRESRARRRGWH